MKSTTQELSEGFSVSIRDRVKAERRKKLAADILTKTEMRE